MEYNPRYCGGGSFPKSDGLSGTACPTCHKVVSGGSNWDAVGSMTRHLSSAQNSGSKHCYTAAHKAALTKACRICKAIAPFRTRNYGLFEYTCQECEHQQRMDPTYTGFVWSHLEAKILTLMNRGIWYDHNPTDMLLVRRH